jgi:hypothetical protein
MASWTTTYNGLVSDLGTFCEDDSTEFTNSVQSFINRAEERTLQDLDITYFDESRTTSTATSIGFITKPTGTIVVQSVYFTSAAAYAQRRTFDYVNMLAVGSGRPICFYEDDDNINFGPVPDAPYNVVVRVLSQPTPLSSDNQTNWLSANVAPLLLNAALVEAEKFLIAPERKEEFNQSYASLLTPARARWREVKGQNYEPVSPTPQPVKDR